MSGLCVAIALLRNGITDVTIYEKADEVGGTWRENTYPGLVCDIPSRVYQYTFARNPDWSHLFSPGGWLDRIAYRGYSLGFDTFAAGLTKPGLRRKIMGTLCRASLREVRDPELRRALTPDYTPMCKRLVMSNGFYRAIQRDDVELVTAGIDHLERRGIVTGDGVLHEADIVVLATGFDTHAFFRPMQVIGRDGITADEVWRDGPRAYRTVALPGFPNFFMMLGPHSPVGNLALTTVAESQADHILRWIQRWRRGEFDTVEPTWAATESFNATLRAAMPDTVWTTGCDSWYLNKEGVPEVWPFTPGAHRSTLANTDLGEYDLRRDVAAG